MPQLASVVSTSVQSQRELELQVLSRLARLLDSPCEERFVQTDIRNWLQPRLCETCKKIDFEALAADTDSSRASRRSRTLHRDFLGRWEHDASLGTLADIISRADHCNLCKLIANVSRKRKLFETYPDFSKAFCGINLTAYAESILSNETVQFNRFNIAVIDPSNQLDSLFPNTILSLQACANPIPSVTDAGKSVWELRWDTQREGIPASLNLPTGRTIGQYVNPDLLREWISICLEDHKDACQNPEWILKDESQHPSLRLIDVQRVCIVDAPADCDYFALSYVWGPPADFLRLLISNEDELRQTGIIWSDERIPKTIRDAASLVYWLGYQYLWVDSLCIVQDDENDKASQIEWMDSIYAQAMVTIVAADGSHANHGLAGWTDNPRKVQQSSVKVSKNMSLIEHIHLLTGVAYDQCTWKTRGWTMQELLCSRRTIMLTADQAFWTCSRADWCETIALERFSRDKLRISDKRSIGNGDLIEWPPNHIKRFSPEAVTWVLAEYLRRSLTNQSDALNAIEPYLYRVAKCHIFAQNIWGHLAWMRFDESLAWSCSGRLKRRKEDQIYLTKTGEIYAAPFPSWSWCGWQGSPLGWSVFPLARGIVQYELEFYRLDIDGQVRELFPFSELAQYITLPDRSELSLGISSSWKEDTHIDPVEFPDEAPFRDSGHLLFWTSKADLWLELQPAYPDLDPFGFQSMNCFIVQEDGTKIGELATDKFPDTFRGTYAGPMKNKFPFVIIARQYLDDRRLRALPKLRVLMLQWENKENCVASRLSAGTVDEDAWIKCKREWIKLTLT
ncbi:unnamed protein product [Alternaria burnsii]|nr:unnamed protein product [Alternaria burnsii]